MKIFYWSPFLSNIATINAVIRSAQSIIKYDKSKTIEPYIIDSLGEWSKLDANYENLKIIKLYKKNISKILPKGGYFQSRFSQILIFVLCFFKLKRLILREKPTFLIAHLIVSLPMLLFNIFNFDTKLIIRISGTPKLNFVRKYFWKLLSKKIYKVTCPTISSYNKLIEFNIFDKEKLEILYDPILNIKEINKKKYEPIDKKFKDYNFILGIGRLTRQKNFILLIKAFNEIQKKKSDLKLIILGEGEQRNQLQNMIKKLNLIEKVFLPGFKKNVYNYIFKSNCFISSSLYEDPGFVLLEAGFLNKIVLASDSKSGTSEIIDQSKRGFLYKNENHHDLANTFLNYNSLNYSQYYSKIFKLKYYTKNFTIFNHYKKLYSILTKN